jgi:pectin methylesterase-like acyl-CoA thioesterase
MPCCTGGPVPSRRISTVAVATVATVGALVMSGTASAVTMTSRPGPSGGAGRGVCVDTPLRLTFDRPPQLGTSGTIQVHRADGSIADSIDLADPASYKRTVGDAVSDTGVPHEFAYHPVIVTGDSAAIYPHHRLDYRQTYYVTVDPEVFPGVPGIRDPAAWRFTTRAAPPPAKARHLTVDDDGTGDFCTVQGAIDAVPLGNRHRIVIDVRPGVYTEIVHVRPDRPYISVRGAGRDRTVIQYANNDVLNGDTHLRDTPDGPNVCPLRKLPTPDLHNCWRAMFGVDAPDFTLENITLHNTTPFGGSQAEAFRGNNDRIMLRHVNLRSFQDTLRLQGLGFVDASYIEGDVDFIWGTGTIYVRDSEIKSLHAGYLTQIRNDDAHFGAVFVRTKLTRAPDVADAGVYLSRIETLRFPSSQAVFIDTAMDAHIRPAGWLLTPDDCAQAPNLRFWEYHSTDPAGRPIDTGARLGCSRQLTDAEAAQWRDPHFVLGGWKIPARGDHGYPG